MPEDWYVPIHDFNEHMAMLDYLHGVYPKVHITLHAGEIAMGLVKPEDLSFHIRASVERGHAERIGHGVSVMLEKDPIGLLKEMAARNVMVEINLTSNDQILGVSGDDHPLPMYMKYGVPTAISSDDEGVARSDMTHEYLRAVQGYHLRYVELKRMTRQSVEHSFLPGQSLWSKPRDRSVPCPRARGHNRSREAIRRMRKVSGCQRAREGAVEARSRLCRVRKEILIRTYRVTYVRTFPIRRTDLPHQAVRNRGVVFRSTSGIKSYGNRRNPGATENRGARGRVVVARPLFANAQFLEVASQVAR